MDSAAFTDQNAFTLIQQNCTFVNWDPNFTLTSFWFFKSKLHERAQKHPFKEIVADTAEAGFTII